MISFHFLIKVNEGKITFANLAQNTKAKIEQLLYKYYFNLILNGNQSR